jgi:hypothetical protein
VYHLIAGGRDFPQARRFSASRLTGSAQAQVLQTVQDFLLPANVAPLEQSAESPCGQSK